MTEGALRVSLHRLRREFGTCLREVIQNTVDSADEIDDEVRHLIEILSEADAAASGALSARKRQRQADSHRVDRG